MARLRETVFAMGSMVAVVTAFGDEPAPAAQAAARAPVLSRSTVLDGGRRVTLIQVTPPAITRSAVVPAAPTALTPDDLAIAARRAGKRAEFASFSAVVRLADPQKPEDPAVFSELTWRAGERTWRAWSNVDFRLFEGVGEIETDEAVWSIFGIVTSSETGPGELDQQTPKSAAFGPAKAGGPSRFVIEREGRDSEQRPEVFELPIVLHAYHDAHRDELVAARQKRETERAQREQAAAIRAAQPGADKTIYFWRTK